MTISVIVPCLKRDETTERCLAEIRRQAATGGATLDLIVVEGVSPCGKARNEGLRRATGDYLAWVDADDEILDGWWTELVAVLAKEPDVVVFGWHDDLHGRDDGPQAETCATGETLLRAVLCDVSPFSFLWNKVIRRELWNGVRFNENLRLMTDFDLLPQVLKKARRIVTIDKVLYRYHYSAGSVCRREFPSKRAEILDIFWRRAERWRDTPFSADARAPWISYLAYCYELVVRAGDRLGDDKLLSAQLRRLRGRLRLVFQTRVEWRLKIKVMLAVMGWTWPQRLSLKMHGVST